MISPRGSIAAASVLLCALIAGCESGPTADEHFKNASLFLEQGKVKAALIEAQNAVQLDGENAEYRWLLAQTYLAQGNGPAATKELEWTRRLGMRSQDVEVANLEALLLERKFKEALRRLNFLRLPNSAKIHLIRGKAEAGLGRYEAAEIAFEEVLKATPDQPEAKRGLARIALAREDYEKAQSLTQRSGTAPATVEDLLVHGEASLRGKELVDARESFEAALADAPRNVTAAVGLARTLLAENKPVAAYKALENLGARARQHPVVRYYQGLAAHLQGDADIARAALLEVIGRVPNHEPSLILLSSSHYASGDLEKAADFAATILQQTPGSVVGRRLLAAAQLRNHKPHLAIQTLEEVDAPENDYHWLALLGTAYMQSRDFEKGALYLQKASDLAPSDPSLKARLAIGHLARGATEEALAAAAAASEVSPNFPGSDMIRVFAYLRSQDYAKALEIVDALLVKEPDSPIPHNLRAAALAGQGKIDEAEGEYRKAIEMSPHYVTARVNLARLAEHRGDFDAAAAELNDILAIREHHAPTLVALARIAEKQGEPARALALLEEARKHTRGAAEPRRLLANHYVAQLNPNAALAVALELNEIAPNALSTRLIMGRAQLLSNRREAAYATLSAAVDAFPQSPPAHHQLALAELAHGRRDKARQSLADAMTLDPGYMPAKVALGRLELFAGNPEKALKIATEVLSAQPLDSSAQLLAGDAQIATGQDHVVALKHYESAFTARPNASSVLKYANTLLRVGEGG
ncbi:MAG: PEP-CTERM system TPR-repeat protein PrsT [Gammaproteobacteria bacterium]|nr:PEP-CTERM system TPR-repeat protein PrsT [Gammaproteobacteria bacterium]